MWETACRRHESESAFGAMAPRATGRSALRLSTSPSPPPKPCRFPARRLLSRGPASAPGITAHRCVHVAGPVEGRVVLVQGGAGAVGVCAIQLALRAGARVLATVRSGHDELIASRAGAHGVVRTDGVSAEEVVSRIRTLAPEGVVHIVEVAFDANIDADTELLAVGGSIAAYAAGRPRPLIPFWE